MQHIIHLDKGRRYGPTWLLTSIEALEVLGFYPKGGLMKYLRRNKVAIDSHRKNHRIAFDQVARLRQQHILETVNVQEEREAIVNALDQMIDLRRQEMAEVDVMLIEHGVGQADQLFRYGRVVDLDTPPSGLWYVYHLCHPNGKPFYIGKGIGKRMYGHEGEARRGVDSYKCRVIRKLWSKDKQIRYRIVFTTPSEEEAYQYEVLEIARIGRKNLTNMTDGGASSEEYNRVFGLNIPYGQENYAQFIRRVNSRHPPLSPEMRTISLRNWAETRIYKLKALRCLADDLSHDEAIARIDTEIESIACYTARQHSFADLEGPRRKRYSEWDFDD